jgi:hypothetical protein
MSDLRPRVGTTFEAVQLQTVRCPNIAEDSISHKAAAINAAAAPPKTTQGLPVTRDKPPVLV